MGIETTINKTIIDGVPPANSLEQIVQSEGHKDKRSLTDELRDDSKAKQRLVGHDSVGRRCCVSTHDQLYGT